MVQHQVTTGDMRETAVSARAEQIQRVLDEAIVRRARGELWPDEALLAEHASLLPELAEELQKLRLIAQARELAGPAAGNSPPDETVAFVPASSRTPRLSRSLSIRCPLCHEPLEIAADQPLDEVPCTTCGGCFSLAGDDPRVAPQPVTQLSRFELLVRLGMGGFGTVWKARDTQLDRTVALKIPRRRQLSSGEEQQFLHEARVAAKLRHPHIVSVHEIGSDDENFYIVSDLVEGVSLDKHSAQRRLTQREAAELLATVCEALHFAHEAGIVHRDLKPGNILVDADGQPHITDFGLAKRSGGEVEITVEGEILGTPAYMSPEQARGEAHLADRRTDVYAVGVMLFELLTESLPFRGNLVMLTHHAQHTEPPNPRSLNRSVSRDLETICLKCLEKDPRRRYATAADVAAELRRYLAGDEILARPITRVERLWRWCRKHPRIPALSAALLAVVLAAYAFAWQRFEGQMTRTSQQLEQQARENLTFTAESIAASAGRDFEAYFQEVESMARVPQLAGHLRTYQAVAATYAPLNAPEKNKPLQEQLLADPQRQALKDWIRTLPVDESRFAWFVMLPDGLQVARNPERTGGELTIGRNYSWRAYFHGGEQDHIDTWRNAAGQHLRRTQLSPPTFTEYTFEWVLVVSTPIPDPNQPDAALGVLGLMLKLGSFTQLPGNELREGAHPGSRFAVLIDSRPAHRGQILQHPRYSELQHQQEQRTTLMKDQSLRVPGEWAWQDDYPDPLTPAGGPRWLASRVSVTIGGIPGGVDIIVQENYDETIGQPLAELRQGLILLSVITFGMSAAVIVPLWGLILRLVR